jgi:large subunit ribosomal protein L17
MANLATALFRYGRIETTLAKAKALRPFAEKLITMAKRAHLSDDVTKKLHYRRLVIARMRDESVAAILFNERAAEFEKRNGGYTRIYKLVQRIGDAAEMALIELIAGDDVGYSKSKRRRPTSGKLTGGKQQFARRSSARPQQKANDQQIESATSKTEYATPDSADGRQNSDSGSYEQTAGTVLQEASEVSECGDGSENL